MKITKYGHACLLVQIGQVKILVDPGVWNPLPDISELDAILITHEHPDHCDIVQVKALLERHKHAEVITHDAVAKKIGEAGIAAKRIEPGQEIDVLGLKIKSYGTEHDAIYQVSPCRNTGFLIGGELFVPGDALHDIPPEGARVLALPTGGPWMRLSEAIDYAKSVQAKFAFPIHDAMYTDAYRDGLVTKLFGDVLESAGTVFTDLKAGETKEF
ncbi:MAG: MBL fold metallo-hydrolase [Patescibacteria group bacterium]|nr:MBL fold metallo-hydrolase [Patescibacteria group bacterium]